MERIYCQDLDEACKALEDALIDFDLDSGNRIMTNDLEAVTSVLDELGIDYDVI